jgi:hypothetical protein
MPIGSMTLSDGHDSEERAQSPFWTAAVVGDGHHPGDTDRGFLRVRVVMARALPWIVGPAGDVEQGKDDLLGWLRLGV